MAAFPRVRDAAEHSTALRLHHADRSELHDLAAGHPEKVRELVNLRFAEAGENQAFPLDDRSPLEIITARPQLASPRDRYTYFPRHRRGARHRGWLVGRRHRGV